MKTRRKLKCKYCDFTINAWYTTRDGLSKSGMTTMMYHVRDNHTPTYELQRINNEHDEDEGQDFA
jgi:hypothetical protein